MSEVRAGMHQFQVVMRRYGDMAMPVAGETLIEGVRVGRDEHMLDVLRAAIDELRPQPDRAALERAAILTELGRFRESLRTGAHSGHPTTAAMQDAAVQTTDAILALVARERSHDRRDS